jgi:uncharacterized protein (DUF1778 family)
MKMSLIPVILSPAEFEAVAAAAHLQGSTIGEFIIRSSLAEARCAAQGQKGDLMSRDQLRTPRPAHPPRPPER